MNILALFAVKLTQTTPTSASGFPQKIVHGLSNRLKLRQHFIGLLFDDYFIII